MSMVKERIAAYMDRVVEHRRWFHQHPELSGQEKETAVSSPPYLSIAGCTYRRSGAFRALHYGRR